MLTPEQETAIKRVEEARAAYYQAHPVHVVWPDVPAVAR